VPVISAVGHERDSTLIDDVAAEACSTPTHAAEALVPLDCLGARRDLERGSRALARAGGGAVAGRARHLAALARGPQRALQRQRRELNQQAREIRAAAQRRLDERRSFQSRIAMVVLGRALGRARDATASARQANRRAAAGLDRYGAGTLRRRREALARAGVALRAHDPQRTLERGYALAETAAGDPVTGAAAAASQTSLRLRFSDGRVTVLPQGPPETRTGSEEGP
jgi:exodeoxyribonuclease VII large subunit